MTITETIQNTGLAPIAAGVISTTMGASALANGKAEDGCLRTLLGFTSINLGTIGHSEELRGNTIKASVIGGAAVAAIQGVSNLFSGLKNLNPNRILKGTIQTIGGAAVASIAIAANSRVVMTVANAVTIAGCSLLVAASGVKDLMKGEYKKGAAKTLLGATGIALAGVVSYNELKNLTDPNSDPSQMYTHSTDIPEKLERHIKLATIFNNGGNEERQRISDLVVENHHQYAQKWHLDHDVITTDLVAGQCTDPSNGQAVNCSPYFNKIQYYRQQCANMTSHGPERWVIYGDDDLVYNRLINPWTAIDKLRLTTNQNGTTEFVDSSVIMAYEPADWGKLFPIPGHKTYDPRVTVNSGFIIARIDPKTCDFMEKSWAHRNTLMDPNHPNFANCPTVGFCKNHGRTSLGDQTAIAAALQDNPSLLDHDIRSLLPRDRNSPYRSHIALNTMARDGCHQGLNGDQLDPPFDIGSIDKPANQHAIPEEDWTMQPAGFRVMGKYPLPKNADGQCLEDPDAPIVNIRLAKIQEVLARMPKDQRHTIAMTYTPDGNSQESQYDHLTEANHREFAQMNGARFHLVKEPLLRGQCTHPTTSEKLDCVPYWNKVQMIREWLHEPSDPSGAEEWIIYGDDDGVYANMNLELPKVIKELQGDTNASVIIAKDIGQVYSKVNTGFMIFRKDEASRQFMEQWIEGRDWIAKYAKGDQDCPTLGLCKSQKGSLHEQEAFSDLYEAIKPDAVRVVDIRDPQISYGVNTLFRHGCFNRKQPSQNWEVNGIHYQTDDDRIDPTAKAKPGDLFMQAAGVPRVGTFCSEPRDTAPHPIRKGYVESMLSTMVKRLKGVQLPSFKW